MPPLQFEALYLLCHSAPLLIKPDFWKQLPVTQTGHIFHLQHYESTCWYVLNTELVVYTKTIYNSDALIAPWLTFSHFLLSVESSFSREVMLSLRFLTISAGLFGGFTNSGGNGMVFSYCYWTWMGEDCLTLNV